MGKNCEQNWTKRVVHVALMLSALAWGAFPAGTASHGQEAKKSDQAARELQLSIRKHLRGLNDADLAVREKAEEALLAMGPKILDLLPEVNERMPAEVKHRLTRVIEKLQRAHAEAALEPGSIALQGEGMALADVLAAVEKQTGNKVIDFRPEFGEAAKEIALDLDLEKQPFWPAMDRILDRAGLTTYNFSGERALAVVTRPPGQLPRSQGVSYSGPFRIEPVRVDATRELRNPAGALLNLQLEISWEPRLQPIAISQPLSEIEATGSGKAAVQVGDPESVLEIPVADGATAAELQLPFELPPRSVEKIAKLRGRMFVLVPGRVQTFRFEEPETANRVERRSGGTVVMLETVRENNNLFEVRIRVRFDKTSGALASHRGWIFKNETYLEDDEGNRIDHAGFETTRQTENEVGLAYLYSLPKGIEGLSLVYKSPAAVLNAPIAYELSEIPLP